MVPGWITQSAWKFSSEAFTLLLKEGPVQGGHWELTSWYRQSQKVGTKNCENIGLLLENWSFVSWKLSDGICYMLNHKVQFIGGLLNEFLTVMRNAMSNGPGPMIHGSKVRPSGAKQFTDPLFYFTDPSQMGPYNLYMILQYMSS